MPASKTRLCYRIKYGGHCTWEEEFPTLKTPCLYSHSIQEW